MSFSIFIYYPPHNAVNAACIGLSPATPININITAGIKIDIDKLPVYINASSEIKIDPTKSIGNIVANLNALGIVPVG